MNLKKSVQYNTCCIFASHITKNNMDDMEYHVSCIINYVDKLYFVYSADTDIDVRTIFNSAIFQNEKIFLMNVENKGYDFFKQENDYYGLNPCFYKMHL